MEVFVIENFKKLKPSTIPMAQFYSHLSDESDQDASNNATRLRILLQFFLIKKIIYPILTTMWDHTGGCAKQYFFAPAIYIGYRNISTN